MVRLLFVYAIIINFLGKTNIPNRLIDEQPFARSQTFQHQSVNNQMVLAADICAEGIILG